jgi:hypothetical protein
MISFYRLSPFVCVVASAFEPTTAKQLFGKHKNAFFFLMGPLQIAFKMQEKSKQLSAAFLLCTVH